MPVLSVLALLVSLLVMPGVARAAELQFTVSPSTGLPGMSVDLKQVDPCPQSPPTTTQYWEGSFTDAAGVVTEIPGSTIEPNAVTLYTKTFRIPFRQISKFEPLAFTQEAAQGIGTFRLRCVVPAISRVHEYAPQQFTVTRSSLKFSLSALKVEPGGTIEISGTDPCPAGSTAVMGGIGNSDAYVNFNAMPDQNTGRWNAPLTVPKVFAPPMFPSRNFPSGKYRAWMSCVIQDGTQLMYGEELLEVVAKTVKYVASGDSYSSGQGIFDYIDAQDSCHQSRKSYPYFVATEFGYEEPLLVACSGAITDDMFASRDGREAQTNKLSSDTELVTLTIGGNDALFDEVLRKCISTPTHVGIGCSLDRAFQAKVAKHIAALAGNSQAEVRGRPVHALVDVYREIHRKAPNAKIFVGGYPDLFGWGLESYTFTPAGYECWLATAGVSVSYMDALWLNLQALSLNLTIGLEVSEARRAGIPVTYVPPNSFSGHGVCDRSEAWLNGLHLKEGSTEPKSESFHPTDKGHKEGYKKDFIEAIRRNR